MESNVKNKKQQAMPKSEAESFGIKRNPVEWLMLRYLLSPIR